MPEEKQTEQEPSIEEILDSIRQIISDDDEEDTAALEQTPQTEPAPPPPTPSPPPPPPKPAPAPPVEEEVVELTDKIEEPEILAEPEPPPEPEPEEEVAIEVEMKESPMAPTPPPKPKPAVSKGDSLLTSKAESAAMEGFAELAQRAAIEKGGNVTIEDVVREELRPLLREWLDRHLPDTVERLVQNELRRISNIVQDD